MHAKESRAVGARAFVLDTAVIAAAQLLLKLRGLVAIPLIVKVLGTAEYGVWVQTLALLEMASGIVGANLHHPLVRFLSESPERGRRIYGTLLAATVAAGAAGVLLIFAAAEPLSRFALGDAAHVWEVRAGALLLLCYNVRLFNLNAYRALGRMKERAAFEVTSTFGQLLGISILLLAGYRLVGVFAFMAAWEAAFAVALSAHVGRVVGVGRFDGRLLKDALRYALPLLPAGLSVWVLDRSDRLVIGYFLGPESVGVYSANYALAGLLMLFQTPLQVTLLPKVSALWRGERAEAVRYVSLSNKLFLTFAIPFVVAAPVVARPLLSRLGNEEIGAAGGMLTFLIAAGVLMWGVSVMLTQIFYGARRTLPVGMVTVGAALLNLLLNFLLVPAWGVEGAAFATLVSYAASCAALYAMSRPVARMDFYAPHLLKCAAASLAMWVVLRALVASGEGPFALAAAIAAGGLTYFAALWPLRAVAPSELGFLKGLVSRRAPEVERAAVVASAVER
ncbi:MAG TPA: flippase [Pyrinomonadaceae bacterium]|jgi:O-antigen/teichoic acid export membrane protein|nr:flippase [Pyrinomonadaceae bacterium]